MSQEISREKSRKSVPIFLKVLFPFLSVCCFITVISGIIFYSYAKNAVMDSVRAETQLISENAIRKFKGSYSIPILRELGFLESSPQLYSYLMSTKDELLLHRAEVEMLFLGVSRGNKIHLSMRFLDVSGQEKIIITGNKRKRTYRLLEEISEDDVFGRNMKNLFIELKSNTAETLAYTSPFYDVENRPSFLVGKKIKEPEAGGFGGIIVKHCDLTDYINKIPQVKIFDTSVLWIYGGNGENLSSPPEGEVKRDPGPFLSREKEMIDVYTVSTGCKLAPSGEPVLTVVCSIPQEIVSKELAPVIWSTTSFFGVLLLMALVSSYLLSYRIATPIKRLTKVTEDISTGVLDVDLDPKLMESRDEIGKLAGSFDKMKNRLKESYANLEDKIRELKTYKNHLEELVKERTDDLRNTNEQLQREMAERWQAEVELQKAHDKLEIRVEERTKELAKANEELQAENAERKRAEEALRKGEEKYRTILESIQDGYFEVDLAGNLTFLNDSMCRIAGLPKDELLGINNQEYTAPETAKRMYQVFNEVYQTGNPARMTNYEIIRKDGSRRILELSTTLMRDSSGEPVGFRGVARDSTEHKRVDEALRVSEEKYRTIIESITEGYYEVDIAGNFTFLNNSLCKILGYPKEEVLGMNNRQYASKENAKKLYKAFNRVYRTGKRDHVFDYEIIRKDGEKRHLEASISLIRDAEGRPAGFRGIGRDITERKQAEEELKKAKAEAEAASKSKSEFLANMSHEIRTPMNAVIGYNDLLLETYLDEDQIDYAKTVKRSGETLLSVINDILDFSKIEAGELDFEETDFDPELLAYDVCELIRPRVGSKPIEILCRIGNRIPSNVKGDPLRVRQVLTNLMGNAPKFTESGEIELSLDIEDEKDDRIKLHAIIRDTGIGIPKDKTSTIFEPFHQADGSTTRKYGGTGLGLSICKKISNFMDGDVWAESEVGKGSTFHFTAWLGRAEDKEVKRVASVSLSGDKVLIVDDNRTNLDILTQTLELIGIRLVALNNGQEVIPALQKAREAEDPFDICIIDLQMPEKSGYDIAKLIRDPKLHFPNLPLIALSSAIERDAQRCEEVGFDGFLSKPIRREKLYQMLQRIIGGKKDKGEKDKVPKEKIMTQYTVREDMKHSVHILLVEDNPVNQKLAKLILTKGGYQVEVAFDGKEAVEKYTKSPEDFDLIFMDIQMPVMDGMESTKRIRSYEKQFRVSSHESRDRDKGIAPGRPETRNSKHATHHIPIVAMTAHAMKGDRERCLEADMDDYITKPIKREIVFEILEKWVFGKEAPEVKRRTKTV